MKEIDKRDKQIIELLKKGHTQKEIGNILGICTSTVCKRIQKLRSMGQVNKRPWEEDDFEQKIIDLRKQKLSIAEIARELNVSIERVSVKLMEIQRVKGIKLPNIRRNATISERDLKIINYIEQGLKQEEIGEILNISPQRVSQEKHRIEGILQKKITSIKRLDEKDKQILELLKQGMTRRQISVKLNLNITRVYERINKIKGVKDIEFTENIIGRRKQIDEIDILIIGLLRNGFSQQKVADTLGFHLGSIRKRKEKIEQILNISLPRKPVGRKLKPKSETLLDKKASSVANYSIQDIDENREELLIKGIVNLQKTRGASFDQLLQIGKYYNIDTKKIQDAMQKEKDER